MLISLRNITTHHLIKQIIRFLLVGGSAFVLDFSLLIYLTEVTHWNYLTSATCSFIVATLFNYILSIYWVFDRCRQRQGMQKLWQLMLFFGLAACGLGINNLIIWFSVEFLAISYILGKLAATAIVMIFNFTSRKILLEGHNTIKTLLL